MLYGHWLLSTMSNAITPHWNYETAFGFPGGLIDNVVRCANGLVTYAAQMAALVSTDA